MVKKTNTITDDELYKMCRWLSDDMSTKVEELSRQHDNMFLTLIWFLIATSGIIITASDVSWWAKRCLWLSIVCFVLWLFYNLNIIQAQYINVSLSLKDVFPIPNLKTKKEKLEALEKVEKWIAPNKALIILKRLSSILQRIWIILFIVWLFIYL